jgi:F-type H+-transporting ATPase subunit epsilon
VSVAETRELSGDGLQVMMVSPTGPITEGPIDGVTAPGELGEFEVLPGHVPFLTKLHAGVLVLCDKARRIFAIGQGVLEVEPSGVVRILVEQAVPGKEVDVEAARSEIDATQPTLKDWKDEQNAEYRNLKARLDWAQAQLDARRLADS